MSPSQANERRQSRRRKLPQLIYLEFGRENGGMVKNVSEGGMCFHLMNPVAAGQRLAFAVPIDAERRIEGQAVMVWTDAKGKSGGLAFTELSVQSRETLRAWLAEIDAQQGISAPASGELIPSQAVTQTAAMAPPIGTSTAPGVATLTEKTVQIPVTAPESLQPVPREVWQRAALEEIAPGDRSRRPLAAAKAKAMREELRGTAAPSNDAEPAFLSTKLLEPKIRVQSQSRETQHAEVGSAAQVAESQDPFRDFLKQPIGGGVLADTVALENPQLHNEIDELPEPDNKRWSTTRLAMIFALAAICGVAAALAAITYHQALGESIIRLGEKIRGEALPAGNAESDSPAVFTAPAGATPVAPAASDKSVPAKRRNSESAADPAPDSSPAPATAPPITRRFEPAPASPRPLTLPQSATSETQLATGREIIPGNPRRPPEDVPSLWIAVENGDTTAEILLANRYAAGEGVEKNCEQARVLLQAAVKHGNTAAAKRLTQLTEAGCQ